MPIAVPQCSLYEQIVVNTESTPKNIAANKKRLLTKPHGSVDWAKVLENWPRHASGDLTAFARDIEESPRFGSEMEVALRSMQNPRSYYVAGVDCRFLPWSGIPG